MTPARYIAFESPSEVKHDYVNGEVYGMSGGTVEQAALAAAFSAELRAQLAGKRCRVFSSDLRIHVRATGGTFYPDVSVICGTPETAEADSQALVNPVVMLEVVSESSERYDRGEKFAHYRLLLSLQEYVLVDQAKKLIEVHHLVQPGRWEVRYFGEGQLVELASLGVSISLDAVYANPLAVSQQA